MTHSRAPWYAAAVVTVAAILTWGPASVAIAHDNLSDAFPAADETVTQVDAVVLTFSGELIDFSQSSFAQVQGPDGLYYESSCSTINQNVLSTPVSLGPSGLYSVVWTAVSSDGHPISEGYTFTYVAPDSSAPGLGWDLPACGNETTRAQPQLETAEPSPSASPGITDAASPPTSPAATPSSSENAAAIVVPIVLTVAVVGALVVVTTWVVGRVRRRHPGEE